MIEVVIDIESTGRTHKSVIAVAFCVEQAGLPRECKVFYMHDDPNLRSASTLEWWNGDPNRKRFLESALIEAGKVSRKDQIFAIREFIDDIYARCRGDEKVAFISDFPVFDVGLVNSMLAEYDLLPIYLRADDDGSPPAAVVNYLNYLRGIAGFDFTTQSSEAFKKLGIQRPARDPGHDPLVDVSVIMDEVQIVKAHTAHAIHMARTAQ